MAAQPGARRRTLRAEPAQNVFERPASARRVIGKRHLNTTKLLSEKVLVVIGEASLSAHEKAAHRWSGKHDTRHGTIPAWSSHPSKAPSQGIEPRQSVLEADSPSLGTLPGKAPADCFKTTRHHSELGDPRTAAKCSAIIPHRLREGSGESSPRICLTRRIYVCTKWRTQFRLL